MSSVKVLRSGTGEFGLSAIYSNLGILFLDNIRFTLYSQFFKPSTNVVNKPNWNADIIAIKNHFLALWLADKLYFH